MSESKTSPEAESTQSVQVPDDGKGGGSTEQKTGTRTDKGRPETRGTGGGGGTQKVGPRGELAGVQTPGTGGGGGSQKQGGPLRKDKARRSDR